MTFFCIFVPMIRFLFLLFLFTPLLASAFGSSDSIPDKPQKYVESNHYDTVLVSGEKRVIRRDSLRKGFDTYFPKYDIVSYNDIDYISTRHLELYLNKNYKEQKRATKKVWVSGAGFPYYQPTTSFGVGGAAILSFHYDRHDTVNHKSYIPISLLASVKGQFALTSGLYLFMKENRRKATVRLDMSYGMANYFGKGASLKMPSINDKSTQYTQFIAKPTFNMLWRVTDDFYIGSAVSFHYEQLSKIAPDVLEALPKVVRHDKEIFDIGLGVMAEYSSIDNPSFPYHGIVVNASAMAHGEFLSVKVPMASISIDYRQYQRLFSPRGVLAWQVALKSLFNNETELFLLNPSLDMRGVMERYYIASTVGNVSLEYRQFIGGLEAYNRGEWWSKIGFTLWANGGMWSDDLFRKTDFVASFGGGLRYEIQPNKNFRFDVGTATGARATPMFYVGFLEYF